MSNAVNVEEIFAKNVFTIEKMKEYLPDDVFNEVMTIRSEGGELPLKTADIVANAMKDWAVSKGATHFTHWFQPLTGITAEKHDAFIKHPDEEGRCLLEFSGKELIKGESDASSFPSGGLRATFEARGYTAWDMSSPAFLKEDAIGIILCIPTAFCSYKGEALDMKTPLLRSMEAVNTQALRLLRLFGNNTSKKVIPSVGAEQEYFLVDRKNYLRREDLIFAGRTLFGSPAPKGQELDDHYYGTIQERIGAFMHDLNIELWKLGVTAKTQHNEVAPAQHELAPIYEIANIAMDHNQLIMEVMKKVAIRHDMACLLHEKPFAGVNGSGKHNNWSLTTDDGINLLDPGDSPNENLQFLLVLSCLIKAVDKHADLLRQSASCVGNDERLGGNEAPPCIISVFLGEQLEDIVNQIVEFGEASNLKGNTTFKTGVSALPDFEIDATDRNRTSPFAFTGNKFEFRSVGSSDSIGSPNIAINTIAAEAFCEACDVIENAADKKEAIHNVITENFTKHQRIIFSGDGYSEGWRKEAEKRGLKSINTMVDAIATLSDEKTVQLFEKFQIFTKAELESRAEILYETYAKTINIEARTMIDMASRQIVPAVATYSGRLANTVNEMIQAGVTPVVQMGLLNDVNKELTNLDTALAALKMAMDNVKDIKNEKELAEFFKDTIVPKMKRLRVPVDNLERIVDKRVWPLPTYADLMFEV
ncbi:MAG: glutamine synthetase III [Lachnospiraceae bacterium]|nr:glutamine synthetase III [Lachnospiraceae bacterium]